MLEEVYRDAARCRQLRSGPLGPYVDAFVAAEQRQGFAPLTLREHLRVFEALSLWLGKHGYKARDLNEERIGQFLRVRRRKHRGGHGGRLTPTRLLGQFREAGVAPLRQPGPQACALDQLVADFGCYLTTDRGLAQSTAAKYVPLVRAFLRARFATRRLRFDVLQVADLQSFVTAFARRHGRSRGHDLVGALRAFLRWLHAQGLIATDLGARVLGVPAWRFSSVPPALGPGEVRRLLRACDRRTAKGCRDYAVLLLLARLGLRAGEVVALRLEDIDWRRAELTVRRKPGREDRLPLHRDVGEGLVAYLRHARPACTERHVFVCMNAPHRALGHSSTVSSLVSAALQRAGLTPQRRGAHLLRHTLATELLRRGATLAEIGNLLGHRSSAATEIYAKVDLVALRTVAQPWPGGVR